MRSSAIFLAVLVGVASASMPEWFPKRSTAASGEGLASTGRPHLGPGPVVFPSGYPSGGPKYHHPEKHHPKLTASGVGSTSHHPGKYHHQNTGSGLGPTNTGGSPNPTSGPPTTTVTHTSDVTSKLSMVEVPRTRTNTHTRHNDFHTLRHYNPYFHNHQIRTLLESHCHSWNVHVLLDLVDHHLFHHYRHSN